MLQKRGLNNVKKTLHQKEGWVKSSLFSSRTNTTRLSIKFGRRLDQRCY